jgi:hypothetical protein
VDESEWQACQEPEKLLECLRQSGRASDRKLRLFAAACVRRAWHLLDDERSRRAVEVVESLADGEPVPQEWLAQARTAPYYEGHLQPGPVHIFACDAAALLNAPDPWLVAQFAGECVLFALHDAPWIENRGDPEAHIEAAADAMAERSYQAAVLRDIFGSPWRPLTIEPSLLTKCADLARAAYEHRVLPEGTLDPARLAVLCDALEKYGSAAPELLGHLRGGLHWRGCHAIDALLGWS